MENQLALTLLVLAGLGLGGVIGWLLASREARASRRTSENLRSQLDEVVKERDQNLSDLKSAEKRAYELDIENTKLQRDAANFDKQMEQMRQAREEMLGQFKIVSGEVLSRSQEEFLKRAEERFRQSEEAGEEKIKALLNPVGDRLKKYEEQVETLEKQRVDAFGQLTGLIQSMRDGQEEVRREAQRLGNSLTNAPKARGRWGERALQNVLEQCGLTEHTDFQLEHSLNTEEGRLRPDAIVNVPGQKKLVIDAKVSLNAYQTAYEADDDEKRQQHLTLHAKSMRNHVQTLGAKSYQNQFEDAPDYVVMFVPGEHFVAAALEHDPELWDFAFEKRVLLATPTNLVAIARTVAQVWRQDKMATEAQEIGRMGAELYDRLRVAAEHMKRVGGGLETAVKNYNKFVGSFERNVLSSGKRLAEKGIETGKREIEEVPLVETKPTYNAEDADEEVESADAK
ncbi:MAG: DNA recombination protein RmuC [Pseudomonadota bacterium]